MSEEIDISGINKAELLAALYNASHQQGMGFCHARGATDMTAVQAIEHGAYTFDYLHGRAMKVDIGGDLLTPWGYDRDNRQGAAQVVVDSLRNRAEG